MPIIGTIQLPAPLKTVTVLATPPAGATAAGGPAAVHQQAMASMGQKLAARELELTNAREALEMAARELSLLSQQLIHESEGQMVDLRLQIAQKVLMQEIQAGRYEIDPIVKEALASLTSVQGAVVHLNPRDLANCKMAGEGAEDSGLAFVADEAIEPAQCMVETVAGNVESSIQGNLQNLSQALRGRQEQ